MDKMSLRYTCIAAGMIGCLLFLFSCTGKPSRLSIVSKPVNRVEAGTDYRYVLEAFDSAGRSIHYNAVHLPAWLQFDKTTHTLSGLAKEPGQYLVQIDARAGDTLVSQHFMLTVYDQETVNILPLGNSITNGTSVYNSYRRDLWQLLHAGGYNFDMVGSWSGHHMGGAVPDPDFDMDHDGHSGWKASDILHPPDWDQQRGNLEDWLQQYRPDIVLMELGTNEVFQCMSAAEAMANLDTIIGLLRIKNPSVKILLAQIPPLGKEWAPKKLCGNEITYEQAVIGFNQAIVTFAKKTNTAASPVVIVDQFTGVDPATEMYDDIHPNAAGERRMAERWFIALQLFLKKL